MTLTRTETERTAEPTTKGGRTRRRLLDHAVVAFARGGFRSTSVSGIAREVGITPGSAYAYFESKEELFTAAVDADAEALIARALDEAKAPSVRDRLVLLLEALIRLLPEHPLAHRVLAGREPGVLDRLLALPSVEATTKQFEEELATAQRDGAIRSDVDVAQLATGLETVILTLLLATAQLDDGAGSVRSDGVLALFDAALRAP